MADTYDVVVIGAVPAGEQAAGRLAGDALLGLPRWQWPPLTRHLATGADL